MLHRLLSTFNVYIAPTDIIVNGCATKLRKAVIVKVDLIRLHAIQSKICCSLYSLVAFILTCIQLAAFMVLFPFLAVHVFHHFPLSQGVHSKEEAVKWKELRQ